MTIVRLKNMEVRGNPTVLCIVLEQVFINHFWKLLKRLEFFCKVWNKGTYSDREEYSIFDREEGREFLDELNDRTTIDASKEEYGEIYVAGLAGDFCVFHTVKDLVDEGLGDWMHILLDGVASIDGGVKLKNLLKECGISSL